MSETGETGEIVGSAPLVAASFQKCARKLAPGEIKRCFQRGPLIGFYIACPGCGFPGSYLQTEALFTEVDGRLAGQEHAVVCYGCRSMLCVEQSPDGSAVIARRTTETVDRMLLSKKNA